MDNSNVAYSPFHQVVIESLNQEPDKDIYVQSDQLPEYQKTWFEVEEVVNYFLLMVGVMILIGICIIIFFD